MNKVIATSTIALLLGPPAAYAQGAAEGPSARTAPVERAEQMDVANILRTLGGRPTEELREERDNSAGELKDVPSERFNKAYLDGQAEGHEKLLYVQDELLGTSRDKMFLTVAKLIRGRVQEHIDLIRTIRDQIRA
jgi:putative membrane protein